MGTHEHVVTKKSEKLNLRTFTLIVSVHRYCACNSCGYVTPRHASSVRAKETFLQHIMLAAFSLTWWQLDPYR